MVSLCSCGFKHCNQCTLKCCFIAALKSGELGSLDESGLIVSLKEFKLYFSDITTQYVASFMPAATFEPGQYTLTRTKFLFRVRRGIYRVHADLLYDSEVE